MQESHYHINSGGRSHIGPKRQKFFAAHLPWVFTNMPLRILLYAVGQPFVAEKAAKGCPSITRILGGSLFRHILSASAAYVFLIAQASKEIRFRIVHVTKCPAMAPRTGIGYRGIPAAPGTGQRHPDRQRLQHWNDGECLPIPGGVAPKHRFQRSLAFEKIIQRARFK
jgi:hypothetical protein